MLALYGNVYLLSKFRINTLSLLLKKIFVWTWRKVALLAFSLSIVSNYWWFGLLIYFCFYHESESHGFQVLELNLSVGISWFSKEWNKFLSCLEQSLSLEYFFSKHKNLLSSPVARNTYQSHIWSILWNTHICCLHECWALSSLVDFSWETCHTPMTESTCTHLYIYLLLLHWEYAITCFPLQIFTPWKSLFLIEISLKREHGYL